MDDLYKNCPVFETQNFMLRLVSEDDAIDLLGCYSDTKAQQFFNTDGFPKDCNFNTIEEMQSYIKFWLMEYSQGAYIRFSVVDKAVNKAIGTIEMFGMVGQYKTEIGILRIDISSAYENKPHLKELLKVCIDNFYDLFEVKGIATKAISQASNRIAVLTEAGFKPGEFNGRPNYFLHWK